LVNVEAFVAQAFEQRPEIKQVAFGRAAVTAGVSYARGGSLPVLVLAGQVEASWTPTRDNASNPYVSDQYNQLVGGLALALLFDVDPAGDFAKADEIAATALEIDALERFAETGIPLQVRQAVADRARQRSNAQLAQKGIKVTRKWLTFAASAYETGASSARDLLEGLAAYLESKRSYYSSLQSYYHADAALRHALGDH
jgi:outer membrane protein TolC